MKNNIFIYIIIVLLGFILNAFLCNMSPWRECLFCSDINCFYMEGKAWALGYIPYVDFIDYKGPLLFLIYAIGYLISPDNTLGVYILASLSTVITLSFVYKTAHHFTNSNSGAMFVVVCCSAALFFKPYYGYGPRTEQFLTPFVTWIMYSIAVKAEDLKKGTKHWRKLGVCLGISSAVFFLTKFVYVVFPVATLFCVIIFLNNCDLRVKKILAISGSYLLSIVACCLPFAIYMFITDSFDDFLWSYFKLSALSSTSDAQLNISTKILSFIGILLKNTIQQPMFYGAIISLASLWLPFYRERMSKRIRLTCVGAFLSLIICCSMGLYGYYFVMYFPLFAFFIIAVSHRILFCEKASVLLSLVILLLSVSSHFIVNKIKQNKYIPNIPANWCRDYSKVEEIIRGKHRAKILYLDSLGQGFGIRTGAVPACPVWFHFSKGGAELEAIQEIAIKNRIPDFVFTYLESPRVQHLKDAGYKPTTTILGGSSMKVAFMLWSKS